MSTMHKKASPVGLVPSPGVPASPLRLCHICQTKPCADYHSFTCEDCKPLSHICHTSVEDGIRAAKGASLADLDRAFEYECKKGGRKTLMTAIHRQISKLKKAGGAR